MPAEIELKLVVAPRDLERLARAARAAHGRPIAEDLLTVYYDTRRHDLWRAGLALRMRRKGRQWIQGVKGGGTVEAGLHRRLESETRAPRHTPEVARIADPGLAAQVRRAIGRTALEPMFRTEFRRRTFSLSPAPGSAFALCFDHGSVRTATKRQPISEIELELEHGPEARLYEFALALAYKARVRVEHRSKAERGYALAGALRASPSKAAPSTVREQMSALQAFRAICFGCLAHLEANREGVLAHRGPEYLHQVRVALRRLRSAFSVFSRLLPAPAARPWVDELRWLSGALGPARDWDVFVAERLDPLLARHRGHAGLAALQRACRCERDRRQRTALRALGSRRYQQLLLGLGAWLSAASWKSFASPAAERDLRRPARDYAQRTLARRFRQAARRGQGFESLDATGLHRLRIAVKKLRYAATFFAPLFPGRHATTMRRALAAWQDALGRISDCTTVDRLLAQARPRGVRAAEVRRLVVRANDALRAKGLRELAAAWKAVRRARRFWR